MSECANVVNVCGWTLVLTMFSLFCVRSSPYGALRLWKETWRSDPPVWQVSSHSPHTAALVPVGLCHCWLVLCPLQHLCNRSGEALPSLTGSGSQVDLTSLPQLPRYAPRTLLCSWEVFKVTVKVRVYVHACMHMCVCLCVVLVFAYIHRCAFNVPVLHSPNTTVCACVHYSTRAAGLVRCFPLWLEVALKSTSPFSLNSPVIPQDLSCQNGAVLMSKCVYMCVHSIQFQFG